MVNIVTILFWLSALVLFYIYMGYPVLIAMLAKFRPWPVREAPFTGACSVVVVAYNEADILPGKIESLLRSDALEHIVEIVVASDGSTDGTEEIIGSLGDSRIRVIAFPIRRGKAAVLNDVVPTCKGDIVVFTDARQKVDARAIGSLLANFADAEVGVVSGELVFEATDATAATQGLGAYWAYEKCIRRCEARCHSVPGATGALYCLRRRLFEPIPETILLDDVAIPMQAVLSGYRCVFSNAARVYDIPSQTMSQEAGRKRRTLAGNAQILFLYPRFLNPLRNPIWFQYVSHKVARLFSPFALIGLLVTSIVLAGSLCAQLALWLQCVLYGGAGIGWLSQRMGCPLRWFGVPLAFVSLNMITLVAIADAASGRFNVRWSRSR